MIKDNHRRPMHLMMKIISG